MISKTIMTKRKNRRGGTQEKEGGVVERTVETELQQNWLLELQVFELPPPEPPAPEPEPEPEPEPALGSPEPPEPQVGTAVTVTVTVGSGAAQG